MARLNGHRRVDEANPWGEKEERRGGEERRRGKSSHVIGRRRNNTQGDVVDGEARVSGASHERNGTGVLHEYERRTRSSKKCEGVAVWRPANE